MSFYQGGMRFAGRRLSTDQTTPESTTVQPASAVTSRAQPTSKAQSNTLQSHPLRQNSVGQAAPYHRTSGHSAAKEPKSFADRANARPDLAVDTSPVFSRRTSGFSSSTPNGAYTHSTQSRSTRVRDKHDDSVPDRSPLQKLEVKLGDISKEEKRARVEEAEHNARQKVGPSSGGTSSRTKRSSVNGTSGIVRKPVPGSPKSPAVLRANGTLSNQSRMRDGGVEAQAGSTGVGRTTSRNDPYSKRIRARGYNAALTGGAAAAAMGAFQSSRPLPGDRASPTSGLNNAQTARGSGRFSQADSALHSTGNETTVGGAQTGLSLAARGQQGGAGITNRLVQPDPTSIAGTNATLNAQGTNNTSSVVVPGQEGDPQSSFDQAGGEAHPKRGSLRFSGLLHPHSEGKARRYRGTVPLTEWKGAPTAVLEAEDLDPEHAPASAAWWEQNKGTRRQAQRGTSSKSTRLGGGQTGSQTSFSPPLMLRCGPLLRYTGMRGDKDATNSGVRSFWRGSVMIVTDDAKSSYETSPRLRLFGQPIQTPDSRLEHTKSNMLQQGSEAQPADPLSGQTKCSPTGRTLYVKPASQLQPEMDLSLTEGSNGLFATEPSGGRDGSNSQSVQRDSESRGQFKEVSGHRLHTERGLTFWRFNLEIELGTAEARIAYRINQGPAISFWVPSKSQSMNVMFHSCNGFSLSVDPKNFSGPDPLWRDVLTKHQHRPFHVMLGGGDQIYNDAATRDTHYFKEWLNLRNHEHKQSTPFTEEMQEELESFYLNRYAMWFSQGLFGMASSQIPMVNVWDDHDIIDGFGSYPHHFMSTPVFSGIGAVAYKYYMLFQHQSLPSENEQTEPSWILGMSPGPYINQLSRSVFMSLGHGVAFVGLDCRTERMREEILSEGSYHAIFDRLDREIIKGETKHLIVLLGIPIAYPRMNFAENILTSRAIDPVKALARSGVFGGLLNKFDGGVEILDDLNDHWTAKHHKEERKWFVEELQDLAAAKSVRITILGGDVHLAAVGQFYSKKKLGVSKDHDHRYMPNVISSAIVNTPPPEGMADFLNKRNKIHHFDDSTDENMIPLFTYDVNGKDRNNHNLLPRRNWCSISPYAGEPSRPTSPELVGDEDEEEETPTQRRRSFSLRRPRSADSSADRRRPNVLRKPSSRIAPPSSFRGPTDAEEQRPYSASGPVSGADGAQAGGRPWASQEDGLDGTAASLDRPGMPRSNSFQRRPSFANPHAGDKDRTGRQGHINLEGGLEVCFNCEMNQKDPAGKTMPYRMLIPALFYDEQVEGIREPQKKRFSNLIGSIRRRGSQKQATQGMPYEDAEPASPALRGDKRYTTMMEERAKAGNLGADGTNDTAVQPPVQNIQGTTGLPNVTQMERLPRSSRPVETEAPEEVRASFEQRRSSHDRSRSRSLSGRSRSGSAGHEAAPQVPIIPQQYQNHQQQAVARNNSAPTAPTRFPIAPPPQDGTIARKRYYAQPFKKMEPPLLGPVNNRIDALPVDAFAARQANAAAGISRERRAASNPVPASTTTIDTSLTSAVQPSATAYQQQQQQQQSSRAYSEGISKELRGRAQNMTAPHSSANKASATLMAANATGPTSQQARITTKDPYAHYYPEAVEANYDSAADDHDAGATSLSTWSSSGSEEQHHPAHPGVRPPVATNTAATVTTGQRNNTHYTEQDSMSSSLSPSLSPQRSSSPLPSAMKKGSKLDRLTGESTHPGNDARPMPSQVYNQMQRPAPTSFDPGPGQAGVSDKAARRLGVGTSSTATVAPPSTYSHGTDYNNGAGGGRRGLGGLVRRLSETKTGRRLSVGGRA